MKETEHIQKSFDKDYPEDLAEDQNEYVGSMYDVYKKGYEAAFQRAFTHGFTCACACVMIEHDQPTIIEDCYRNNFHSIKQLKELGVEKSDINQLRPIIKEIERKTAINKSKT